ncbi:MAG: hypothetical protein MPN21_07130 [Thermoanaerobaculia bacterium]|nr:hypothetical protein [Thermoanaerobaculia bacterium]
MFALERTALAFGGARPGAIIVRTLLLVLIGLLVACRDSVDDVDSEPTVDVEPTLEVSTENDVVEERRADNGLSGILPGDFPGDVPLVLPASLVDYGEEDGAAYIELVTHKGRQSVEQGLVGMLLDRGWDLLEGSQEGEADELRLVKDQRPLRVVFRESDSGSVYRVVY